MYFSMANDNKYLYQILYPKNALVGSQLPPEEFGKHFQTGSSRFYAGKVIFSEVDINYRNDYLDIENCLEALVPHEDGRPKATKYISCYRVLEHLSLESLGDLFLVNPNGTVLRLKQGIYEKKHHQGHLRTFADICPLTMLVITTYDAIEYAKYITTSANKKGAPQQFYTQIELDVDQFMKDFEANPFISAPISFLHPSKLRDAINEVMKSHGKKPLKGLSLRSDIGRTPWTQIRHGFWIANDQKMVFWPMLEMSELEKNNYGFYRSMV